MRRNFFIMTWCALASLAVPAAGTLSLTLGGHATSATLSWEHANGSISQYRYTAAFSGLPRAAGTAAVKVDAIAVDDPGYTGFYTVSDSWNQTTNYGPFAAGTSYTPKADYSEVTVNVSARPNTYTVAFDAHGGSVQPSSKTVTYAAAYGELPTPDARAGHTFTGWFTAATGGTKVTATTSVTATADHTLHAQWTADVYKVTFDANGGETPTATKDVTYAAVYGALPVPTRKGHTFGGWFTALDGGTQVIAETSVTATADHTLHAQWTANVYKVTFDANGGETPTATKDVTYGAVYGELPVPTQKGFGFDGWFTAATGGTKATASSTVATAADHTLHAHWTVQAYAVSFVSEGGGTFADIIVTNGFTYAGLPTPAARDGFVFVGWFTAATGGEQVTEGMTATIAGPQTLYAQWSTLHAVTLHLDREGPDFPGWLAFGATTNADVLVFVTNYLSAVGFTLPEFGKTGFEPGGWHKVADCSDSPVKEAVVGLDDDRDLEFWAKFTPRTYTVTLDGQGADTQATTQFKIAYGQSLPTDKIGSVPTRTGHTFMGYFAEPDCGGVQYYLADGTRRSGDPWRMPADVTFYAGWTPNPYTVAFDANGGTGEMLPLAMTYGVAADLPPNAFVRTGYVFDGWSTNGAAEVAFADGAEILDLTTVAGGTNVLSAVWTPGRYRVAFKANGGVGDEIWDMPPQAMVYDAATALNANAFVRQGYAFAGWATNEAPVLADVVYADGATVTNLTDNVGRTGGEGGQVTLYAVWRADTYDVTLDAGDGGYFGTPGETTATFTVTVDGAYAFPEPENGDANAQFDGWKCRDAYGNLMRVPDVVPMASAGYTAFVAQWRVPGNAFDEALNEEGTTLEYQPGDWHVVTNGGEVMAQGELAVGEINEVELKTTLPGPGVLTFWWKLDAFASDRDEDGYPWTSAPLIRGCYLHGDLDGIQMSELWGTAVDTDWTEVSITNTQDALEMKWTLICLATYGSYIPGGGTAWVSRVTWAPASCTVKFNGYGGYVATDSLVVTNGLAIGELPEPEAREGLSFVGWFTDEEGGEQVTPETVVTGNVTYYARWTPLLWQVMFDANGGTVAEASRTVAHAALLGNLPVPVKTGYTCTGWFTAAEGGTAIGAARVVTEDLACYAQWQVNDYTVAFDANGGDVGTASKQVTYDAVYGALPVPTRKGHTFGGWFTEKDGGVEVLANTVVTEAADHTLYAHWTPVQPQVVFDGNGGNVETALKQVTYGTAYGELPVPTRAGYTFDGWFTEETNGTKIVSSKTVDAVADHTLYAHWTAILYTVTFDANGGRVATPSKAVTYNAAYGELPVPEARTGYTFGGWFTEKGGGEQVLADTVMMAAADHTIYAHWAPVKPRVVFDGNGGDVGTASKQVTYDAAYGELPAPTRKGHTFDGWFTEKGGGEQVLPDTVVATAEEHTVYAHWTVILYTVTFAANGGNVDPASKQVTYGTAYGELPVPTRAGYTFDGWFTEETNGTKIVSSKTVNAESDHTLYAHWTKVDEGGGESGGGESGGGSSGGEGEGGGESGGGSVTPDPDPEPEPEPEEQRRLYETVTDVAPQLASEYNGYLLDADGSVKGIFQLKVGKPNKKTSLATVSATVQIAGAKSLRLKAEEKGKALIATDGPTTVTLVGKGAAACTVTFGAEGLVGSYGTYTIDGARNFFASKDKAEQEAANGLQAQLPASLNIAWDGGMLGMTFNKKGKVKVSGTLASGAKVSSSSGRLLIGAEWFCVPVVWVKKADALAFVLWLRRGGDATLHVDGLGEGVVAGPPQTLQAGAVFRFDTDAFVALLGDATYADYLPAGLAVTVANGKWRVADGAKTGKVQLRKGAVSPTDVDAEKAGANPAALKLTYKAKNGSFKGSFKAYTVVKGKPKATTVTVAGVLVKGVGYGTAAIKKVGSVPVTVEQGEDQ